VVRTDVGAETVRKFKNRGAGASPKVLARPACPDLHMNAVYGLHYCGLTRGPFFEAQARIAWLPGGLADFYVFATAVLRRLWCAPSQPAAVFARIAPIPEMLATLNKKFAAGVVRGRALWRSLIPVLTILVIYAIIVEQDVANCFAVLSRCIFAIRPSDPDSLASPPSEKRRPPVTQFYVFMKHRFARFLHHPILCGRDHQSLLRLSNPISANAWRYPATEVGPVVLASGSLIGSVIVGMLVGKELKRPLCLRRQV